MAQPRLDRRHVQRHTVAVPATVTLRARPSRGLLKLQPAGSLAGRTHDMSIEGLSVIVPHIEIDGCSLGRQGASLLVNLKFPNEQYQLIATTVRYQPYPTGAAPCGYLIGLHIRGVMGGKVLRLFKAFTQYGQRLEQHQEAR